jgi:hypothetical protein
MLILVRVIGLGAAIIATFLWCLLLWDGTINGGITGGTYVVAAIMISFALLAVWGTLTPKPWALLLAFVGSFVPIGLYTLGLPGNFRFVGYANLLYLFTAMLMILGRKGPNT